MAKIELVPSLANEIAEINARNLEDKVNDEYKVQKNRRMLGLFSLVIPAALFQLSCYIDNNPLKIVSASTIVGVAAILIIKHEKSIKETNEIINNIYDEKNMERFKQLDEAFFTDKNITKLFMDKYNKQVEKFSTAEIVETHDNISKGTLKRLIKRNEKCYYNTYSLPENLIKNDEFNILVDSIYDYLDENHPDVDKELFIMKLFRLMYADALVNKRNNIQHFNIGYAIYYQKTFKDKTTQKELSGYLDKELHKVIKARQCEILEFKKRQ